MTLKGNYASKCAIRANLGLFDGKDVCKKYLLQRSYSAVAKLVHFV